MNQGSKGWNQIMSLPRKLKLKENDVLKIEPTGDIESLRYDYCTSKIKQ